MELEIRRLISFKLGKNISALNQETKIYHNCTISKSIEIYGEKILILPLKLVHGYHACPTCQDILRILDLRLL